MWPYRMTMYSTRAAIGLLLGACFVLGLPRLAQAQDSPDATILTLEQARQLLTARNWDYALAQTEAGRADLVRGRVRAGVLPSLSLDAAYTLNDDQIEFAFPNIYAPLAPYLNAVAASNPELPDPSFLTQAEAQPAVVQFRHDYRAIATLTQTLFNARVYPAFDLATLTQVRAEQGLETAELELQGALTQMYFGAVGFQRFIGISERGVELAQIQLDRARVALEEGVGDEFEVYRAEVAHSTALRNLENARVSYALAVDTIATFLEIEFEFDVTPPPELPAPASLQELLDRARQERPDLRAADTAVEIAEERLNVARNQWYPLVFAQATAWVQRESEFGGNPYRWSIMVGLSWSILDGGIRHADISEAEIDVNAAGLQRQQAQAQLEAALRQAWMRMENQQNQLRTAEAEVELAERTLELTEDSRRLGVATTLEVELAQAQLTLSELSKATAETQLQAEIYELYRLSGEVR